MKTLPVIAFLAALVAVALLPFSPAFAASILFMTTLAPIVLTDYSPARLVTTAINPTKVAARRSERLGLAA